MIGCSLCNYDRHWCPGCGTPTPHRKVDTASPCAFCVTEGVEDEDYWADDELEAHRPDGKAKR